MFSKEELDCFRNHLHGINDSNSFPEEGEFQLFLDKSLSTLENENPSYRPAGSDCKPGGLLDFSSENKLLSFARSWAKKALEKPRKRWTFVELSDKIFLFAG